MKKELKWQIFLGLSLMAMSAVVYSIHYLIFRDSHHIFIYLMGDLGFVFLEVMLVTLIVHQLLSYREKRSMINKLNMVIGVFFSEVGLELLRKLKIFDAGYAGICKIADIGSAWDEKQFTAVKKYFKQYPCGIDVENGDMEGLKTFLKEKRGFLLNLLENQNLLEHESFTDLLWAVFHLTEELLHRTDLSTLTGNDMKHLAGDIRRAYTRLVNEWINYMQHLNKAYPYLFSLAIRMNPFDDNYSVEIS